LFEQQADLQDPATDPAVLLGDAGAEQVRSRELAPERAVEPFGPGLDLLQPIGSDVAAEDVARQRTERILVRAEREVHVKLPRLPDGA
jgi:hypothetical protein